MNHSLQFDPKRLSTAAALVLLCACAPPPVPMVAFDRFPDQPSMRFQRVASVVREEGYRVLQSSSSQGRIEVASHAQRACSDPARFVVELYRDRWVRVYPLGCGVREPRERAAMPDAVYRDYVRLVGALRASARLES